MLANLIVIVEGELLPTRFPHLLEGYIALILLILWTAGVGDEGVFQLLQVIQDYIRIDWQVLFYLVQVFSKMSDFALVPLDISIVAASLGPHDR